MPVVTSHGREYATTQIRNLSIPALASTTRLDSFVSNARYFPCFQRTRTGFNADPLSDLCVRNTIRLDLVEPVGIEPTTPCLQSRCSPS